MSSGPIPNETRWQQAKRVLGSISIPERVLLALCHEPRDCFVASDHRPPTAQWNGTDPLWTLRQSFPAFDGLITGARVLDYGCGDGFQTEALAKAGAAYVFGVDLDAVRIAHGEKRIAGLANARVGTSIGVQKFDVAISLNSFEHFPNPEENLAEMASSISEGGRVLASFGPPWLAPYGSHMHFMTKVPWVNILFSEKTVFRVRRLFRDDGAAHYKPGVNGMTVGRFFDIVSRSPLKVETVRLRCVAGQDWLAKLPLVREFFVNQIDAVLIKPSPTRTSSR